jgi:2-polyprenyl-3-methyl-5-hydroxy-6-metoxy-1,4-benzoquinol methylase
MKEENYIIENRTLWNKRVSVHVESDFYKMQEFINGKSSLNSIELELLGDVKDKTILHLQCHFGQDSLSLSRMGALVTGVDFSDAAIHKARELNIQLDTNAEFICCDVYSLKEHLDKKFDIVFTSYGTIGWLPDMDRWAHLISHFLKPGGSFVFAEFHPTVWMFDDNIKEIKYSYFNTGPIILDSQGTYTNREADIKAKEYGWNHSLEEVIMALLNQGLRITAFHEFNYSPYNCFKNMVKGEDHQFYFEHIGNKMPMVYALTAAK